MRILNLDEAEEARFEIYEEDDWEFCPTIRNERLEFLHVIRRVYDSGRYRLVKIGGEDE